LVIDIMVQEKSRFHLAALSVVLLLCVCFIVEPYVVRCLAIRSV